MVARGEWGQDSRRGGQRTGGHGVSVMAIGHQHKVGRSADMARSLLDDKVPFCAARYALSPSSPESARTTDEFGVRARLDR